MNNNRSDKPVNESKKAENAVIESPKLMTPPSNKDVEPTKHAIVEPLKLMTPPSNKDVEPTKHATFEPLKLMTPPNSKDVEPTKPATVEPLKLMTPPSKKAGEQSKLATVESPKLMTPPSYKEVEQSKPATVESPKLAATPTLTTPPSYKNAEPTKQSTPAPIKSAESPTFSTPPMIATPPNHMHAHSSKQTESQRGEIIVLGTTPDQELLLRPKWLIFSAEDGYRNSQYSQFSITNTEEHPVAYRMRTRNANFPLLSHCHGFLEPLQSVEVTAIIPSVEHWPRDLSEFAGRRHKVVVESLRLPEDLEKPLDRYEREKLCRKIFHVTASKKPHTRIYLKLNILLPKAPDGLPLVELTNSS